ncbi:uncharacterized protein LOC106154118 isoform X5 [Lingula anatina]|uniref:Uncharacterized protein LOC106154118 isoform X5 n=1 Tax=Lingula anatina TaxID=7574 RepID=A0A2R2MJT5_LINAN|nr:uncharacterized protein LOC106154118 isoform X5 [Lingula anatina]|eukprot:XP_023930470.1 uncharacterized protein LOC106154118 isoform X5 [Lingula anatina]
MITSYFYHGITMSGLTVYLLTALFLGMLHTCTGQGAISFIGTPYFARVYPGAPAGTHVITVTAVPSSGITTGQPIRYYISNNANKYFSIDHTSGKIEVKKSYSTSKGQQFIFDVIARQGSKIGQTRVSVEISEENKYPPVFSRPSYNTVVWRRSSVGTTILIVSTSDNDTAPYNRLVRYSVNATSSDSSYFSIDPRSGKVNLRQQLPQAQSVTQIEASIVATDPGVPEMTASVTLSVNISLISEPTQLETKFSNETTVLLCWREPAHGSQIKGYLVEYWPIDSYDARRSETVRADKFSSLYCTTVGNLTSWDVYHFQVSAYNDDGYGVPSVIPNVPTVPRGVCGLKPCRNEGTCVPIRQRPGFKCQCKEGYYGRICERKTACASQPCLNNGQCVPLNLRGPTLGASITAAFILSYRCRCPPGTSGKNCEHVDACFSNPCQNLGSCINLKSNNSYACRCLPMNYGTNCELSNHCHSSPCKNSGTCRNLSNSPKPDGYSCDCLPGYSGSECELFDPCFSSPCLHKGSCTPLGDRFSCTCPPGYYNDTCELINACELHTPCKNNATCVHTDTVGDYMCTCAPGWTGFNCTDYNACLLSPCANNATCVQTDGGASFQCNCLTGYYGDTCQSFNPCVSSPCFGNATCLNTTSDTFQCQCPDGYYGKICDQTYNKCVGNTCENMNCTIDSGRTEVCSCTENYFGNNCQYFDYCSKNPCENNGTCQTENATYKCTCIDGYYGNHCQFRNPCVIRGCLNGGKCENVSLTDFICHCRDGYSGENCETYDPCASSPCQNGALCNRSSDTNFTCICGTGFYGELCDLFDPCSSNPCSVMSTCNATSNENFTCECSHGYYGERCDFFDICSIDGLCENGGTCRNASINNTYTCDCPAGFWGEACEMIDPCFTADCKNNATCRAINETNFECACAAGYTGEKCESIVDLCASNPCSETSRRCTPSLNNYTCDCMAGFAGPDCAVNIDECASSPCHPDHSTYCKDGVNAYLCECKAGFTGANCEIDLDECRSDPCQNGGSCDDGPSGYTCSCQPGYSGVHCQIAATCQNETLINSKGKFVWPKSRHSQGVVSIECPYGSPGNGQATRRCSVDSSGMARWETPQLEQCNELGPSGAREVATKTVNATSVPENLAPEKVSSVADEMQIVVDYATVDMEIAKNMLTTISNVMDADEEVLHESNDQSHAAERLLQVLEHFTESVNLTSVSKIQLESSNIAVEAMEVPLPNRRGPENSEEKNTTHGGVKTQWKNTRMFLPTEVFEQSASEAENVNATTTRVSFVYYANSKFFMEHNHSEEKYGSLENRGVVAATVKNTRILNLTEPVVFTLPNVEVGAPHICAFWNATARVWSTDGLEVNSTDENSTTCFSRHLTNFAILLDPTPSEAIPLQHQISLALISYIGCGLSLCGLVLTILTYGLFRCLHGDNSGKILINLCASMLLMNITFVAGTARSVSDAEVVCTVVAVLLHYFTLTTLMWMLVEAVHMYRLLVKIFRTYEPRFMLKRLLIAWGIPLIIVGVTVGINVDNYGGRDDLCRLTSANPYVYYISFLGPSCLILIFNSVVFVLVSRVILRPRVKGLQGKRSQEQPKVSAAQVRGAISVMVLLGITWVFGAFAAGEAKVVFAYIFCVANSLQGFLIFLFRCLLHPEARSAWVQLVTTGTFKKTRSRASSRASSGEHTNSHNSNHDNRRTFKETFTTNKIVKNTNVWHKARRFSSDSDEKNLKPLKYHDINLSYTFEDKFDNPLFKALNNSPSMAGPDDTKL